MKWRRDVAVEVAATRADVYAVLTHYEAYNAWLPGVTAARILAEEGDVVVSEFLSPRLPSASTVLELVETAPSSLLFSQVDQFRSRGLFGRWDLEEREGGVATHVRCRVSLVTGAFDLAGRRRLRRGAVVAVEALRRHCERERRPGRVVARRQIVSVVRGRDAIAVSIEGRRYRLVSVEGGDEGTWPGAH